MSGCDTNLDLLKTLFNTWLSEKVQSGEVQAGLLDCENRRIGQWSKVMLCCPGCGDDNGNGGNKVDKHLIAPVIINEQAKTMTLKVKDGEDVVVDVTAFLRDTKGVTNIELDKSKITYDPNSASPNKIVLEYDVEENGAIIRKSVDLPIIGVLSVAPMADNMGLEWIETDTEGRPLPKKTWTAPRDTIGQPTFNNDTRVLTIPQNRYVNGELQGTDNWVITIPATGTNPGVDNDTTVNKLEWLVTDTSNGKEYKVKLTDTAGGTVETDTAIVISNKGPESITPPGSGQTPKPVYYFHNSEYRANQADDPIPLNGVYDRMSSVKVDTFYNSEGTSKVITQMVANPISIATQWNTEPSTGLTSVRILQSAYDLAAGQSINLPVRQVPFVKLENPEITGQNELVLKIAHYTAEGKVNNSDQSVSIQLPVSSGETTIATVAPASTVETELPLKLYGKDRSAMMAEPHAWAEVVASDGHTYLYPLYRKV